MKCSVLLSLLLCLSCSSGEHGLKPDDSTDVTKQTIRNDDKQADVHPAGNKAENDSNGQEKRKKVKNSSAGVRGNDSMGGLPEVEKSTSSADEQKNMPVYICFGILIVAVAGCAVLIFMKKKGRWRKYKLEDCPGDIAGGDATVPVDGGETQIPIPMREDRTTISSIEKLDRFSVDTDNSIVVGASVRGKGHIQTGLPCQDNCKYTYLHNGWGIAVVSDGAGSASKSQIGSKIVTERATVHFADAINEMKWIEQCTLPSNEEWAQIAYSVLRKVHDDIAIFAQAKDIDIKELGATAVVMVHSPSGLLATHIGDGRAGYRNQSGEWLSAIVPHKGEEINQTIFITSDFWDRPSFRMSGQLIPQSVVIREKITGFTLMSDGCENTSWQVSQMDMNSGKVCDPNLPFSKFFDSVTGTLVEYHDENTDIEERAENWYRFLDVGKAFANEVDDKTLILGILL